MKYQFESAICANRHIPNAMRIDTQSLCNKDIEQIVSANTIEQVFQYYQLTLENRPELKTFVRTSSRIPLKLKDANLIGASDRTLGVNIPASCKPSGGATRGLLKRVGLLTTTGGEYFRGCVVFAQRNTSGQIDSAIGIRFGARIRAHEKIMITWRLPTANEYKLKAIKRAKESFNAKTNK